MLDKCWGSYELPWHEWNSNDERGKNSWGDGSLRRFWVPPVYENRVLAQNAVFVLDGVPISDRKLQSSFRKPNSTKPNDNWKMADLLGAGSIYMKLVRPGAPNKSTTRNMASTYTIEITSAGKKEIRKHLQTLFGYTESTIYPDVEGLATHLHRALRAQHNP